MAGIWTGNLGLQATAGSNCFAGCVLHTIAVFQAKEKGVKIIDEDGLFSLIDAAPAPDAPLEEPPPPASISAGNVSPVSAAAPSASGRRMPASFSGRAAPSAPAAAPSTSHAGVCQARRESIICQQH